MWKEEKHMTIEEARAILGREYDQLPDEWVENMINLFTNFAKLAISQHIAQKRSEFLAKKTQSVPVLNRERHQSNKMPLKATMDQKIKWHIDHVAHCKCRPMPIKLRQRYKRE